MARITIDYTPAAHQNAGIGRLTREVTRALLAIPSPHRYTLFCMGRAPRPALPDAVRFTSTPRICITPQIFCCRRCARTAPC